MKYLHNSKKTNSEEESNNEQDEHYVFYSMCFELARGDLLHVNSVPESIAAAGVPARLLVVGKMIKVHQIIGRDMVVKI
ncbi:hypothetical protein TKK_0011599 [Trichogramma kaykai]